MDSESRSAASGSKGVRHFENDWLTVLATVVVFLFHCARYFNDEGWHVKNPVESSGASLFVVVVSQWIMPLFFLLSGMSSGFSLRARGAGRALSDRAKRLMVPFLFSTFILSIPLQVWAERVSHGEFHGSFWAFYPQYFDGFYAFGGNFAWMGLHLWYLLVLCVFTVLTWSLFRLLNGDGTTRRLAGFGERIAFPGGVLLLVLPLIGLEYLVNLDPGGVGMRAFGGWSLPYYLAVFLLGFLVSTGGAYREGFRRSAYPALVVAVITTTVLLLGHARIIQVPEPSKYPVRVAVLTLNSWAWLCALYGLGCRYLSQGSPRLKPLRELALPFYVVHQTVIVGLGLAMLGWDIPVAAKYPLLAVGSLAVILALLAVIRRTPALRPFFGMVQRPR